MTHSEPFTYIIKGTHNWTYIDMWVLLHNALPAATEQFVIGVQGDDVTEPPDNTVFPILMPYRHPRFVMSLQAFKFLQVKWNRNVRKLVSHSMVAHPSSPSCDSYISHGTQFWAPRKGNSYTSWTNITFPKTPFCEVGSLESHVWRDLSNCQYGQSCMQHSCVYLMKPSVAQTVQSND
jgi:hypothetical protein